ncbi:serine/threonine-protein kinase PAK 2-like [Ruditapes philippinarum]|uniref:serine/threonine-protein kinase PAK 2-like n=1 Tax=Ruditapes philippinarum TaxID=129788 RepID=UPI00295A9286|nr:serine/threonine-protein kinase PAK 2-like [Ruditapes philippinarum]
MDYIMSKMAKSKSKAQKKEDNTGQSIGCPFEVHHNFHVGFDHLTGDLNGLPPAWKALLGSSDITTEEQKSNPEAVINSLKTYSRSIKQTPDERYLKVIHSEGEPLEDQDDVETEAAKDGANKTEDDSKPVDVTQENDEV